MTIVNNDLKIGIGLKKSLKKGKQLKSNVKFHMIKIAKKNPSKIARFFRHKSIKYSET